MGVQIDLFKGVLSHKHKIKDLKKPWVFDDDVKVIGTFTVEGMIIQEDGILVQGLLIEDNIIVLNNGETGAGVTLGTSGTEVDRGTLPNAYLVFNETDDLWHYGFIGGTDYIIANTDLIDLLTFSDGLTRTLDNVVNDLITGKVGGQTIKGGIAASENLTITSTANATKGKIILGTSAYDEVNNRLGIGIAAPTEALDVVGNTKISQNLKVVGQASATEKIITTGNTDALGTQEAQLQTDSHWITDTTLITALLLESNWTVANGYIGTTVGAVEGQEYILNEYRYVYQNGAFYREILTTKRVEYRDEYIATDWIKPVGVAAPDVVNYTLGGVTTSLNSYDGNNTEERMSASFEIPHDIALNEVNAGTEYIELHVHCMPTTNTAGNVEWFFDYAYVPLNAIAVAQTSLTSITTIAANQQYFHKLSSFKDAGAVVRIPIPASNFNIGDIIIFTLRRTPTGGNDTYPDDVILIKVAMHIPITTRGSKSLYSKYN